MATATYWEFHYRKDLSDDGHLYIAGDFEEIPDAVKSYAVKKSIQVPDLVFYTRGFSLLEFLNQMEQFRKYLKKK